MTGAGFGDYPSPGMTLQAGHNLGPYEMLAPIAAGGMGEVWRARDTRLERSVAIKVLPEGFAKDEQFRQRFEREARAISQLSHPNICVLHDVGEEEGQHFLVMELLEGESLADRLSRGPLPLHEVLRFGAQIAQALDAAHRAGITHRDVKPGNVMLTKSGAKLLDFGLAKVGPEAASGVSSMTSLPTEAKPLTEQGTILGTFQYMAPEQLEGLEADARTDIFALGALLYEMTTGKRAFEGGSRTSLIAAIVSSQPAPVSTLQPATPPALDHVVRKCLEKDPEDRWQSAHDVAGELSWISQAGSQAGVAAPVALRRKTRERLAWGIAATGWMLAVAALVGFARERAALAKATWPVRTELLVADADEVAPVVVGAVALSPDGARIALHGAAGLRVRDLETGETTALAGTDGAGFPFWSPDGQSLGFFADGRLKRIAAGGGPVQVLADTPQGRGGTWSRSGEIVFAPDIQGPLLKVPAAGGTPVAITKPETEHWTHRNPHALPDGRHVLFIARDSDSQPVGSIVGVPIGGGPEVRLLERGSNPQYASGHLFWVRGGNLLAQPFDPISLELSGEPAPLADRIEYYNARDVGNFSVSGGSLAWRRERQRPRQLMRLGLADGEAEPVGEPGLLGLMDVSRDGRKVLLERQDPARGGVDLWVIELAGGRAMRATFDASESRLRAAFSPDGERLVVGSGRGRSWATGGLTLQAASGGGERETLLESTRFRPTEWSPDGLTLVGSVQETETAHDIAWLSLDDPGTIHKFVATPFIEFPVQLSPDGRWLAYVSNETGGFELYVSDFPEAGRKWQVSNGHGTPGSWSPDGEALYYADDEGRVVMVPVSRHGESLEIGTARTLDVRVSEDGFFGRFFVTRDGLVTLEPVSAAAPEPIRLVRHWERLLEE